MFAIGDKVYKPGRYGRVGTIITITGMTPAGNVKASDGNIYTPTGWQRGGDKWNRERIAPLTDRHRVAIVAQAQRDAIEKLRREYSVPAKLTPDQLNETLELWVKLAAIGKA